MKQIKVMEWFDSLKKTLEESYLQHDSPWRQSGFSGPEDRWVECRRPIADCIETSGSFLDIGCANGYLLECIVQWTADRNLTIMPYGLDFSDQLLNLAKQRLPKYKGNLYLGNAWFWEPPVKYDYVRTETVYVPECLQKRYIERTLTLYVKEGGRLLITEYRSRKDPVDKPWIDTMLRECGLEIMKTASGFYDNKELTRVFVIPKSAKSI